MRIRESVKAELSALLDIHAQAFGNRKEPELVQNLLDDPTAQPLISLVAEENAAPLGHILFTAARLTGGQGGVCAVSLLAPLAVSPQAQGSGIGQALMREGLSRAKASGRQLVFVLGHPSYYPKAGFRPAGDLGFEPPYSLAEKDAPAWMAAELEDGAARRFSGKVNCADALDRPEYWRE